MTPAMVVFSACVIRQPLDRHLEETCWLSVLMGEQPCGKNPLQAITPDWVSG